MMGALFVTVAGFVALACGIYAVAAISASERRYGFFPFLFLMMGGVSGAFLTGDIFNLYVWFEVLLIGSFGLLILGSEHDQLDGATKYCFLNLMGTTLFLITVAYLYGLFGTLNMADIAMKARAMKSDPTLFTARRPVLRRLRAEGGGVPAEFLAPGLLSHAALRRVGAVRRAFDQDRHLRDDPHPVDAVSARAGRDRAADRLGGRPDDAGRRARRPLRRPICAGCSTMSSSPASVRSWPGLAIPQLGDLSPLAADVGQAADVAAQAAYRTGLSGAILYALHSIVVMTGLYLAAGVAGLSQRVVLA